MKVNWEQITEVWTCPSCSTESIIEGPKYHIEDFSRMTIIQWTHVERRTIHCEHCNHKFIEKLPLPPEVNK